MKGKSRYITLPVIWLTAALLIVNHRTFSQDTSKTVPDGTEGERLEVPGHPTYKKPWNSFNLGFTTFKFGLAFLYEYDGFTQNDIGKRQMDSAKVSLESGFTTRDFRFLFSGKLNTKRTITWKFGLMYDGSLDAWFVRESGFMIAVPELWGSFFIGRTKEGFSLSKVMSGYAVETMERHMATDPIPILADGIKWMGFLPKPGIFWNLGIFTDWTSHHQSFSTYSSQFAARVGWLPIHSPATKTNLHVAANIRFGHPENDSIRLRSRPEANAAPFFISTEKFHADQSTYLGYEVYYSQGPWMLGTEYYWHRFRSPEKANPVFNGGEAVISYFFTGESRPYTTDAGNIYGYVPVKRSVFKGGPGALEAVFRFSAYSLNDGIIQGGKFWKITPMVNWYLSDNFRFELAYGYGKLDRFNLNGTTHFLQSRIQFMIR